MALWRLLKSIMQSDRKALYYVKSLPEIVRL